MLQGDRGPETPNELQRQDSLPPGGHCQQGLKLNHSSNLQERTFHCFVIAYNLTDNEGDPGWWQKQKLADSDMVDKPGSWLHQCSSFSYLAYGFLVRTACLVSGSRICRVMSAKGDNASNQVTRSTTVREITIVSAWSNRAWSNSKSMSICNILIKMYTIRTKKEKAVTISGV